MSTKPWNILNGVTFSCSVSYSSSQYTHFSLASFKSTVLDGVVVLSCVDFFFFSYVLSLFIFFHFVILILWGVGDLPRTFIVSPPELLW